jgi:hypothetical protein
VLLHEAFALEDSPSGQKPPRAAGIACGVTRSACFATTRFEAAAGVRDDLDAVPPVTLASIRTALPGG